MKRKALRIAWMAAAALCAVLLMLMGFGRPASAETVSFDLAILINMPDHVAPGAEYVVRVIYSNLGEVDSPADTQVTVTLPAGVQFVSAVDRLGAPLVPSTNDGSVITWDVGAIPAGDCNRHILVTLKAAGDLPEGTELPVQANITPTAADANPANNMASDTSLVCDMAGSSKQVSAHTVKPGDVLTYTLQLRLAQRSGPMALQQRSVVLTDTLPVGHQVRFLGWSGPVTGDWDGHTLRWQGQVRAGEPLTLQYRVGVEGEVAPGTVLTNTAHLGSGGMQLHLGPVTTTVELPGNAAMIGPQGQHWQPDANLGVTVPANAVGETTRFEFQPLFTGEPPAAPPGHMYAHRAFELTAFQFGELHQFGQPITLTLKLKPDEVTGFKKESLQLWYRNRAGETWAKLGTPAWVSDDTLAFTTNHFTQFALFAAGNFQLHLPVIVR